MARTFVFEGSDLVGKSTTAKLLAEKLGFRLERNVAVRDAYQLVSSVIEDIERARGRNMRAGATTLFDRWQLISDIIYCEYVFSVESRLKPFLEEFFEQCASAGIYFVVFHCSDDKEMVERFQKRGDDERSLEEIMQIQKAYLHFFQKGRGRKLPAVFVDTANKTPEQVAQEVKKWITVLGGVQNG